MPKAVRAKLNILAKARTIPTGSITLTKLTPNNNCKSIVVYGSNLGSNIGFKLDSNTLNRGPVQVHWNQINIFFSNASNDSILVRSYVIYQPISISHCILMGFLMFSGV